MAKAPLHSISAEFCFPPQKNSTFPRRILLFHAESRSAVSRCIPLCVVVPADEQGNHKGCPYRSCIQQGNHKGCPYGPCSAGAPPISVQRGVSPRTARDQCVRIRQGGRNTSHRNLQKHESPRRSAGLGKRAIRACASSSRVHPGAGDFKIGQTVDHYHRPTCAHASRTSDSASQSVSRDSAVSTRRPTSNVFAGFWCDHALLKKCSSVAYDRLRFNAHRDTPARTATSRRRDQFAVQVAPAKARRDAAGRRAPSSGGWRTAPAGSRRAGGAPQQHVGGWFQAHEPCILPAAWITRRHSRRTVQLWPAADGRPLSGPASTTFTYRYSG